MKLQATPLWVTLLSLCALTAVNFLEFRKIDLRTHRDWAAFPQWHASNLTENIGVRRAYGLYVDIGRLAPDVQLVLPNDRVSKVPTQSRDFISRFYGIGRVSAVVGRTYDPKAILSGIDYGSYVVARGPVQFGPNQTPGPKNRQTYVIAILDPDVRRLVFTRPSAKTIAFLDERLLPVQQTQE